MQTLGIIIAFTALLVSVITALIAARALKEQVRVIKLTVNYTAITTADNMLINNAGLIELYGIDKDELKKSGIEPIEVLYLAESFHAAELYHQIENTKPIVISEYRKHLLRNEKVRTAWKSFIKDRFAFHRPFTDAIDEVIRTQEASSNPKSIPANIVPADLEPNKSINQRHS